MRSCATALLLWLVALPAVADEARLSDGRTVKGTLTQDAGHWVFLADSGKQSIALTALTHVRFSTASTTPLQGNLPMRIVLRDGSQVTGSLVELDGKSLVVATASMGKLTIPRSAIAVVRQPSGWLLMRADDLHKPSDGWKTDGKLGFDDRGVSLDNPGDALSLEVRDKLMAGRVAINVQSANKMSGGVWVAEAEFAAGKQTRRLSIHLSGYDAPRVVTEGLDGVLSPAPRTSTGRLVVQFSATSMRVSLDDQILWHSLKSGPGVPLVSWRLACQPQPSKNHGTMIFSAFSLHRAVDEPKRPAGDATQDEVWQASGDQLFGRLLWLDREGVQFEGRFPSRTLPWSTVRGVYLKEKPKPEPVRGAVRLRFENGFDATPDVLIGIPATLTARKLSLKHRELGEITLDRSRLRRLDRD